MGSDCISSWSLLIFLLFRLSYLLVLAHLQRVLQKLKKWKETGWLKWLHVHVYKEQLKWKGSDGQYSLLIGSPYEIALLRSDEYGQSMGVLVYFGQKGARTRKCSVRSIRVRADVHAWKHPHDQSAGLYGASKRPVWGPWDSIRGP